MRGPEVWSGVSFLVAAIVLLPILAVVWMSFGGGFASLVGLWTTTLPRYLVNSVVMMAGVGAVAGAIGTGTAWLIANRRFPMQPILKYALLMPMAVPAYIAAYALVDFLEYAGPFQTVLRSAFGWESAQDYWFPEIRSRWAGILVMGLALYPYVYLFALDAFQEQGRHANDVARSLGASPRGVFWRVSLPLARPALVAGVAIVMMEALNDFGTVEYFAIQTLTTGIFTEWLEANDRAAAAQIAALILGAVLVLALVERGARRDRRFDSGARSTRPIVRREMSPTGAIVASCLCFLPVLLGFILPISILALRLRDSAWDDPSLWDAGFQTLALGASAALLAVGAALLLQHGIRHAKSLWPARLAPITAIGYATPGAVLAIGILLPLAALDHLFADTVLGLTGWDPGLLLTGTTAALVLAYAIRFFAIAQGSVESGLARVTPAMDMAARTLGQSQFGVMRKVHFPLLRGSLVTALLLIFVDTVKELPATLILRPFGVETLATRVYNHASLEDLERAAPAALLVTAAGLVPVLILASHRAFRVREAGQADRDRLGVRA